MEICASASLPPLIPPLPNLIKQDLIDGILPHKFPLQIMRPRSQQHQRMQRRTQVNLTELRQSTTGKALTRRAHPRRAHGQPVRPTDALAPLPLDLEHLIRALSHAHEARRLEGTPPPARHVLGAALLDLDVQQHQRVQAQPGVLAQPVIERRRPPRVGEEDHAHDLAEVVQLQPRGPDGRQDGRVRERLHGNSQLPRAQDEVCVRRCAGGGGASVDVGFFLAAAVGRWEGNVPEWIAHH